MEQISCLFCGFWSRKEDILFESEYFFTRLDKSPVNKGHILIIPKRHQLDIFTLTPDEWEELQVILTRTKKYIDEEYKPDGYNVGVNCGEVAGQTVFHLHIYVIPRYAGDVEKPHWGIRNFKKPLVEY